MNNYTLYFREDEEYEALILEIISIVFYFFTIGTGCLRKFNFCDECFTWMLAWPLATFNLVGILDYYFVN